VAIDGQSGSGKSTLAAAMARELGLPYINTGLMYRALTAASIREGVGPDDGPRLARLSEGLRFTVAPADPPSLVVEGSDQAGLTSLEVEERVSAVSGHPVVRDALRPRQRDLGRDGAVMEGRDIGSVVFPDAAVKIFLVAPADDRAGRRAGERAASGDEVASALRDRDRQDAVTNPPVPPTDAVVLDTGALGVEATLRAALEVVRSRAPWLLRERPE
jgi:cytidylate kinase